MGSVQGTWVVLIIFAIRTTVVWIILVIGMFLMRKTFVNSTTVVQIASANNLANQFDADSIDSQIPFPFIFTYHLKLFKEFLIHKLGAIHFLKLNVNLKYFVGRTTCTLVMPFKPD